MNSEILCNHIGTICRYLCVSDIFFPENSWRNEEFVLKVWILYPGVISNMKLARDYVGYV